MPRLRQERCRASRKSLGAARPRSGRPVPCSFSECWLSPPLCDSNAVVEQSGLGAHPAGLHPPSILSCSRSRALVWPHSPGAAFGQCPRAAARSPTRSGERIEVGMADEATPITSGSAANRRMKDAWTNTWSATAANAKAAAYGQAGRREPSILQHLGLVDRGPKWRAEWGEPVPLDRRAWLSLTPAGSPVRAGRRPREEGAGGGSSDGAARSAPWWTMCMLRGRELLLPDVYGGGLRGGAGLQHAML